MREKNEKRQTAQIGAEEKTEKKKKSMTPGTVMSGIATVFSFIATQAMSMLSSYVNASKTHTD